MTVERQLLAAQGYLELGMFDEAIAELDSLEPGQQKEEGVLQLRLFLLMRSRKWMEGVDVCALLREISPELTIGFIHGAFCLHELGQTGEAKELLLSGPPSLLKEPTYFYNLGCYEACLGNKPEAVKNLQTSFEMNERFREIAKFDPDLKAVTSLLE